MKATAARVVDAPIDRVWTYVSSVEHMADWVEGVDDVVRNRSGAPEPGERFESSYSYRGKTFDVEYEVTHVSEPTRLDIRALEGPFPFVGSLRLEAVEGGTRIVNTIDAGSDGPATTVIFRLFGPVLSRLMGRQLRGELDTLAAEIERAAVPAAG